MISIGNPWFLFSGLVCNDPDFQHDSVSAGSTDPGRRAVRQSRDLRERSSWTVPPDTAPDSRGSVRAPRNRKLHALTCLPDLRQTHRLPGQRLDVIRGQGALVETDVVEDALVGEGHAAKVERLAGNIQGPGESVWQ